MEGEVKFDLYDLLLTTVGKITLLLRKEHEYMDDGYTIAWVQESTRVPLLATFRYEADGTPTVEWVEDYENLTDTEELKEHCEAYGIKFVGFNPQQF